MGTKGGKHMKTVTIEQVMGWDPCEEYTREKVEELFSGRESLTARDIVDLYIPAKDKVWALLHNEFISDGQTHLYACDVAERALVAEREAGREPDERSWAAIEAKRAWLDGKITDEELAAAREAARGAAWAAAWEAARRAAWGAAWEAARGAARGAAWGAAWAAAWGAAWGAAWEAARRAAWEAQLELLLQYIEEDET
jgi:hypothetical protein